MSKAKEASSKSSFLTSSLGDVPKPESITSSGRHHSASSSGTIPAFKSSWANSSAHTGDSTLISRVDSEDTTL
ncbi:hypothetical protein TRICI_004990 [Trichomonascus ciferrii]|uniref:Uncharacterized protein n=1 Tax=Trichomonascus ciferrii TaxID=44093 RepID=A0A642UXU9_9ASCO|nr:hypothetical protein TRICI_004990 [Trichomonascus ciferrii]